MKKQSRPVHSTAEILDAAGISQRTLTRWFAQGLLALPRRGARVPYGEEHLLRARAASTLRNHGLRLSAIRERLDAASRAELEAMAKGELAEGGSGEVAEGGSGEVAEGGSGEEAGYPAVRCEIVEIAPGLTLTVRGDCDPAVRRMAKEMYEKYGPGRRR